MIENNDNFRPARNVWRSLGRGFRERCPNCGKGRLFRRYLKVADACPACGEDLHHQRADDAPAYFTIVIVGHFVVGGVLWMERMYSPASWVQAAVWLPLTVGLTLLLLPRVKGALVGLQWALRMHGFGGVADQAEPPPVPRPPGE